MDSNTLLNSAGGSSAALFILIVFLLALLTTYWILASNKRYDEEETRKEDIRGKKDKSKKERKELRFGSVLGARDKREPAETATEERPEFVVIENGVFTPSSLEIRVGTTVTWTNQDEFTHNIRSVLFNSSDLHTAESFSFRFENPGVYRYYCGIHPSMRGKITVLQ